MSEQYCIGAVYKWSVLLRETSELFAVYIGSTRNLCPGRLVAYLHPKESSTNRRINSQLKLFSDRGYTITLEIIKKGSLIVNDLPLDFLDFETQRDRLFIENLLLAYYRLRGIRLLNL